MKHERRERRNTGGGNFDGEDAGRPRPARSEDYVRANIFTTSERRGRDANTNLTTGERCGKDVNPATRRKRRDRYNWAGRNMSGSRAAGRERITIRIAGVRADRATGGGDEF